MRRVVFVLLLLATLVPSGAAQANHADHCVESEPGPSNGGDVIVGTPGDDAPPDGCLVGGNGSDVVRGRGGDDVLIGNHGSDLLRGGGGDDSFWGGRGPDTFICGPGWDVVHNEFSTGADTIDESCEAVRT